MIFLKIKPLLITLIIGWVIIYLTITYPTIFNDELMHLNEQKNYFGAHMLHSI